MTENRFDLRERTRRAVRAEITAAAKPLFAAQGFEGTTVDDIAAAVGMSPRSVFRYFASKEEIILAKLDEVGEEMIAVLAGRPEGEPIWTSFGHMFAVIAREADTDHPHLIAEPLQRMVFETPTLMAHYLQKLAMLQDEVVAVLVARAKSAGAPYADNDPAPRALTAAAFGCLVAAQHSWLADPETTSFADALTRALAVVRPA